MTFAIAAALICLVLGFHLGRAWQKRRLIMINVPSDAQIFVGGYQPRGNAIPTPPTTGSGIKPALRP